MNVRWIHAIALTSALGCALQYVVPEETDNDADTSGDHDCPAPEVACDDGCVVLDEDPLHCGRCDLACNAGDACVMGKCVAPCEFDVCGAQCIDVSSDPANCGECGRWCDSSAACIDAMCVSACSESCDNDAEICVAGQCTCREGLSLCDGDCVDIDTDDKHCGLCGRDCNDVVCNQGECDPAGCGTLDQCEDSCTDLDTDPLNCGVCERSCHPSQSCAAGICVSPA